MFHLFLPKRKDHLVLVAMGRIKPSKVDFTSEYSYRRLIHLAALFNNLALFKECIKQNDLQWEVKDFWGDTPLAYALEGQSLEVLNFLVKNLKVNIHSTGQYGIPCWWKGFKSSYRMSDYGKNFTSEDYLNYINFLKENNVNFNQMQTQSIEANLGYELLSSYNFKPLYYLLTYTNFNVNAICRNDWTYSLGHYCSFMEDHRMNAMLSKDEKYKYLKPVYQNILSKSEEVFTDKGESILDLLVKSGYQNILNMYLHIKNKTLTDQQFLISRRYQLTDLVKDKFFVDRYGHLLFYEVEEISANLYKVNKQKVLISGFHNDEFMKVKVKPFKEIENAKKIESCSIYQI